MPPNQAETMVAALERNGVPHAYLAFEGEQHGFRKSETEIRCLEAELYFYGRILGFEPADVLEPVEIPGLGILGQITPPHPDENGRLYLRVFVGEASADLSVRARGYFLAVEALRVVDPFLAAEFFVVLSGAHFDGGFFRPAGSFGGRFFAVDFLEPPDFLAARFFRAGSCGISVSRRRDAGRSRDLLGRDRGGELADLALEELRHPLLLFADRAGQAFGRLPVADFGGEGSPAPGRSRSLRAHSEYWVLAFFSIFSPAPSPRTMCSGPFATAVALPSSDWAVLALAAEFLDPALHCLWRGLWSL